MGALPRFAMSALVSDGIGGFYGTTYSGGTSGLGTVYRFDPAGPTVTMLHGFAGFPNSDGEAPAAPLVSDGAGSFYGTTTSGGASGNGTIYRFDPTGPTVTVLHAFGATEGDGRAPWAELVSDGAGRFFGTTIRGGTSDLGTIYRFDPAGPTVTVLYSFAGGAEDGALPYAALVSDGVGASSGPRKTAVRAT